MVWKERGPPARWIHCYLPAFVFSDGTRRRPRKQVSKTDVIASNTTHPKKFWIWFNDRAHKRERSNWIFFLRLLDILTKFCQDSPVMTLLNSPLLGQFYDDRSFSVDIVLNHETVHDFCHGHIHSHGLGEQFGERKRMNRDWNCESCGFAKSAWTSIRLR